MQINSATDNSITSFDFRARNENDASHSNAVNNDSARAGKSASINSNEKVTVVTPVRWKQIELSIAKIVNESSTELHEGLEKIFKEGNEHVLSGKSGLEYDKHIKELASAIEGQDYANAEKIIDKFFTGDKEKIVGKVQSLVTSVQDGFWNDLRDEFKNMAVAEHRTIYGSGEKPDEALPYVLRSIDRAKAASADLEISSSELAKKVTSSITGGVEFSKGKLDNAGQNRYSETAESVTYATARYAKDNVFGGTKNAIDESRKGIEAALDEIYANPMSPSDEAIDRIVQENRRKDDDFSKYLFKGGEEYLKALKSELGSKKLASRYESTRGEETAYQDHHNSGKGQTPPPLENKGPITLELTMKIQDTESSQALFSPVRVTELYGQRDEDSHSKSRQNRENDNFFNIMI